MLNKGDKVIMTNCIEAKKHDKKVWTCISDEFQMCGSTMIMLEGKSGGFDVECLKKVTE